jgi:hypothetical protein
MEAHIYKDYKSTRTPRNRAAHEGMVVGESTRWSQLGEEREDGKREGRRHVEGPSKRWAAGATK